MAETVLHPPAGRCSPIEEALDDTQRLLGLRMTLHDLAGVFVDRDGASLLDRWRGSHRRYATCAIGYCRRCLSHCFQAVNKQSGQARGAFVHECWKGFVELVVPIRREGVHLATLFAGQWRQADLAGGGDLPSQCRELIDQLPQVDPGHLEQLSGMLEAFATGLLIKADELRGRAGPPRSRREVIHRFLELRAAGPIGLEDLAAALHLSPSRTSHLVKELTGATFQDLLVSERLRKAQALLRSTDLTVAEIGRLVGIDNECYFSRLFRSRIGMAPGAYRRQGPGSGPRPDVAEEP
jgi:AraC family transcriptional regulator